MYLELNVYNWYTSMCSTRNWQAYRFRANWRLFSITIKTKCMYLLPVYVHPFSLFIYKKEADFYLEYKHIWNESVKKKKKPGKIEFLQMHLFFMWLFLLISDCKLSKRHYFIVSVLLWTNCMIWAAAPFMGWGW